MNQQQFSAQWNKIIAKAWADDDYKQRLISAPAQVLAEEGIDVPAGMRFEVVESTPTKTYLVLPVAHATGDVVEGDERQAACSCW